MIRDYWTRMGAISRDARLFLVTQALVNFSTWGGIYAVLLNLYLVRLGYGPRFIGLINGAGLLALGTFSLPAGLIGTYLGVRRALIAGMGLAAIGFVALPFAEFAPARLRSPLLLGAYFLGYLGVTAWGVNGAPFLAAATGEGERSHAFSVQAAIGTLASFAGSLVAGFLPAIYAALLGTSTEEAAPYRYALLSAAVLLLAGVPSLAATGRALTATHRRAAQGEGKGSPAPAIVLSLIALVGASGEGAIHTFLNVYLDAALSLSTSWIGTLSALARLLALPAAMAMPLLVARIGKRRTILLGDTIRALFVLPLALLPHWPAAAGGFVGMTLFGGLAAPAFSAFQQEIVPPRWRAAVSGAITMAYGLGLAVASFGGGYLAAALGYRGLFLAGAALMALGVLTFGVYFGQMGK